MLLESGADPLLCPDNRETPLIKACQGGHLECVQLLMSEQQFETREEQLRYMSFS